MSLVAGTASRPTGLSLVVGDGGWQSRESTRTRAKHRNFGPYGWGENVVPDGFGVAYTSGFDDFLQFTVTSRTEMPNQRFCDEIERAAEDLYNLHASAVEEARKSHL